MALPVTPPVQPMLASPVDGVPEGADLMFEPKWDGFRCLVFRDGDEVVLQSRSGKPLNRYFPEAEEYVRAECPDRVVLDGELVVDRDGRLDWDALGERVHPAASRVRKLAAENPSRFIAFDLLASGDRSLLDEPGRVRRQALVELVGAGERVHRTPSTQDPAVAREWFTLFEGAGLDGIIGKPLDGPYTPNKRTMVKVKHSRTADCVVAGLRWHTNTEPGTAVGSLLLGLIDANGVMHHAGVVGSFTAARRRELAEEFSPLLDRGELDHPWLGDQAGDGRRLPGAVNRWRSAEATWLPLRRERVVEVAYDHTEGANPAPRFRHTTQFVRWRPDRDPDSCRYDQLDEPTRFDLGAILTGEVR
ncbi:ATP-dependent DNA ligase [Kutzneria albida]|nr:ATP-dependent DNA ligase [Kutzneria albida]